MKLTKVLLAATPLLALAALPALGQDPAPVEAPEAVAEAVAAVPEPGQHHLDDHRRRCSSC